MKIEVYFDKDEIKDIQKVLDRTPLKKWWRGRVKYLFARRYASGGSWQPMFWWNIWLRLPIKRCAICDRFVRRTHMVQGYCPECVRDLNAYHYGTGI